MILLMVGLATILILGRTLNPQPHDKMRSLGWRAFGALNGIPSVVFGLAFMLPHRTHFVGPFDRVTGAMLLSSAVGIVGFAYGRRYGRPGHWKWVAFLYAGAAAKMVGFPIARLMALGIGIRTPHNAAEVPLLLGLIVYLAVMSWGLLRYAGFFEPDAFRSRSFS